MWEKEKKAFEEGKRIQYFSLVEEKWFDCDRSDPPLWLEDVGKYRIHPEDEVALSSNKVLKGTIKNTHCVDGGYLQRGDFVPVLEINDKEVLVEYGHYKERKWILRENIQIFHDGEDLPAFVHNVSKRHIHADVIHAWAEGAEIQVRGGFVWNEGQEKKWEDEPYPDWNYDLEYRVKPETPKSRYLGVYVETEVFPNWCDIRPLKFSGCIGYLEDKQDGSVPVFHPWEE